MRVSRVVAGVALRGALVAAVVAAAATSTASATPIAAVGAGAAATAGPDAAVPDASVPAASAPPSASPVCAAVAAGDAIDQPLTATPGDPARGRALVVNRQLGLCLLCHRGPFPEEHFQGTLAPDLAGAGARWTPGQLRLRLVDGRRLNPQTMMPSYGPREGLVRVGAAWQGRPVLEPQQIEDVIAFLGTLK